MARGRKAKGLGDTIEQITTATGIKAVVDKISEVTGIDCGCEERKDALNKLWSYRQPNCISEDNVQWLTEFLPNKPEQLTIKVQERLKIIYKEVFSIDFKTTSCGSCWRDMIREIERVYEVQTNEQ
jgi:hypothetical protein